MQVIIIDFQGVICTFTTQQSVLVTTFMPSYLVSTAFQSHSVVELEQWFKLMFKLMR